jgi:hypothetical protein
VTWNKFHAEGPQVLRSTKILGFTAPKLFARATCWPGFVHTWYNICERWIRVYGALLEWQWQGKTRALEGSVHHRSLGLNPDFHSQRPKTICLKDGTAFSVVIGQAQSAWAGLAQWVQWVDQGMNNREVTVGLHCGGRKSLSSLQRPRRLAWPCNFLSKVRRGKALGAWNKPLQFGANVKNTWSYTFVSQCGFILWSLIFPRKCLGYDTWRRSCTLN